ncbi:MAG: UPF0104 family protein [Chloroflexi bacterium]|nr:MAG: UPF0104 family protein [Chloroflexota bacterium]
MRPGLFDANQNYPDTIGKTGSQANMNKNSSLTTTKNWIIGIGIILLFILVYLFVDFNLLATAIIAANWKQLLAGVAALLLGYLFLTLRLRYILLNQAGLTEIFYGNSIGFMLHTVMFMPASVARIVTINWVAHVPVARISSGLLIERLLFEQVMRVTATVVAISLFALKERQPGLSAAGGLLMLILVFGLVFWLVHHQDWVVEAVVSRLRKFPQVPEDQVRNAASTMLDGLSVVNSTRRLIVSLLFSALAWCGFLLFYYLVLDALVANVSVMQMLLVATVTLMVMPPSINVMLIVYHVTVVFALSLFQLATPTNALAYAIVLHFIQMCCWLIFGGLSLRRTNLRLQQLVDLVKEYSQKNRLRAEA